MKNFKQLLFFLFCALSFVVQAQKEIQYLKVTDEKGRAVDNVMAMSFNYGVARFSDNKGLLALSGYDYVANGGYYVTAPGYMPAALKFNGQDVDTLSLSLKVYRKVQKTEEARLAGLEIMSPLFLTNHNRTAKIENQVVQKRSLYLNQVPREIKGVSGRIVPSVNDTGKVLSSLRWSDLDFVNKRLYQEEILGSIDTGLFKDFSEFSVLDMVWDVQNETFTVNPLSNLQYPSPIALKNVNNYNYYLLDSVLVAGNMYYRVDFDNSEEYSPLFQGTIWVDGKNKTMSEMHLKLRKENQINFTDSLEIHFYENDVELKKEGNGQHVEAWLNILGYKLKLDVSTLLLDTVKNIDTSSFYEKYRVLEYPKRQNTDTLAYFSELINGGTSVAEGLNNVPRFGSKDYMARAILQDKKRFMSSFLLTGANYHFGHGYFEMVPLLMSMGFNTVEGWYINYRGHYHVANDRVKFKMSPYLRYGFASKTFLPRLELDYTFNPQDPIRVILEGGTKNQQFNSLEPIDPFINSLYSIAFSSNYLKLYQKQYVKFVFDKELIRGLELVFSFEAANRIALFNNTSFTLVGDGSGYEKNNPERPPEITEQNGFSDHQANTAKLELYYQFGRRYDFRNNKLKKLKSPLPRVSLLYRTGFGFKPGMPNYDFIRFGVGSKTRMRDVGLFEMDLTIGGFYNVEHIEFPDFQHFNGVQTAFINRSYDGWTDVRQFSTLPYYDYSTKSGFAELHLKHRFLGWLLSKPKNVKKFMLQSYTGINYLYVSDVGQYGEIYFGVENIFRVFNVQTAVGISSEGKVRGGFLLGLSFDYMVYFDAKSN